MFFTIFISEYELTIVKFEFVASELKAPVLETDLWLLCVDFVCMFSPSLHGFPPSSLVSIVVNNFKIVNQETPKSQVKVVYFAQERILNFSFAASKEESLTGSHTSTQNLTKTNSKVMMSRRTYKNQKLYATSNYK